MADLIKQIDLESIKKIPLHSESYFTDIICQFQGIYDGILCLVSWYPIRPVTMGF